MDYKIPESFELFGRTYKVIFDDEKCRRAEAYGLADYTKGVIYLQKINAYGDENVNLDPDLIYQTFIHEKIHLMLECLNKDDLSNDEELIDSLAGLFHQAEKTAKFKK